MRTVILCGIILGLVLNRAYANGGEMNGNIPAVTPTYVGYAPKLDGKISDHAWSSASKTSDFRLVGSGAIASQQTEVRVCYDRTTLYVRFECLEDKMGALTVTQTEDGSQVWVDDSVEVYLTPFAVSDEAKCKQFVVNAAGVKSCVRSDMVQREDSWRATAARLSDRWVAEMAIPLDILKPLGRNEAYWRVNFCRNEHPHGEESSWSPVKRWFATYSRMGKLISPDAPFHLSTYRGNAVLLNGNSAAPVGSIPVTHEPVKVGRECIIPEPQEMHNRVSKAPFRIKLDTKMVIDDDASEEDMWTVDEINATIKELGGQPLDVVHSRAMGSDPDSARNAIVIGENPRNTLLRAVCDRDTVRIPRSRYGTGSHVIDVLPERIIVAGASPVDTYYGAQTLKQILRRDAGGIYVASVSIRDFARFQFRGVHLLTSKDSLTYITHLIENVLAPMKINQIVLQTDKIAWASHPEVTDKKNFMPREDVPKLLEVARRHHIAVTPLVESPGHLEWAFRNGANLDIAEDPSHPYCYCMSNPKSYEFIFSIMDEAIDLFGHPEYFHAGRDEFDMLGTVPYDDACKSVGKEKLYIQDTQKIYEHLKSKGCKMMMWGDVLRRPSCRDAVGPLPKDILINDWFYSPSSEYPSLEFYHSHGFPVLGCTWRNPKNIFLFSSYAAKHGAYGMLQTTWNGWKTEQETLRDDADQVCAYILGATWAWNPIRPSVEDLPYRPDTVFNRMWYGENARRMSSFSTVSLGRYCNISRIDSGRAIGWLGGGRGNDLRGLPDGLVDMEGVPYQILPGKLDVPTAIMLGGCPLAESFPKRVDGIRVDTMAAALDFLHGAACSTDLDAKVGNYVVHYEDGQTAVIDLAYGKNIFAWDDQSTGMSYGYAWRGRAQDGRMVGVSELRWTNPRPNVKITSVDFVAADTEASPFLLALTAER